FNEGAEQIFPMLVIGNYFCRSQASVFVANGDKRALILERKFQCQLNIPICPDESPVRHARQGISDLDLACSQKRSQIENKSSRILDLRKGRRVSPALRDPTKPSITINCENKRGGRSNKDDEGRVLVDGFAKCAQQ